MAGDFAEDGAAILAVDGAFARPAAFIAARLAAAAFAAPVWLGCLWLLKLVIDELGEPDRLPLGAKPPFRWLSCTRLKCSSTKSFAAAAEGVCAVAPSTSMPDGAAVAASCARTSLLSSDGRHMVDEGLFLGSLDLTW